MINGSTSLPGAFWRSFKSLFSSINSFELKCALWMKGKIPGGYGLTKAVFWTGKIAVPVAAVGVTMAFPDRVLDEVKMGLVTVAVIAGLFFLVKAMGNGKASAPDTSHPFWFHERIQEEMEEEEPIIIGFNKPSGSKLIDGNIYDQLCGDDELYEELMSRSRKEIWERDDPY